MIETLFYKENSFLEKSNSHFRLNMIEGFYTLVVRRIHFCGYRMPKIGGIGPAAFLSKFEVAVISIAYRQLN